MKVTAKIQDTATVDARNRDNAKRQNASTSDEPQQFDGVFSDVKTDASAPSVPAASGKATAPEAQAGSTPNTVSVDVLLELLGKGAATASPAAASNDDVAAASKDTKTSALADTGLGGAEVDGVLQKMAAKDAAAAADAANASTASASGQAPTDLVSLLLLGAAGASPPPAAGAAAATQDGAATKKNSATAVPGARDMPLDGTDHTDSKEVIVSDVAIETHLAPAAPNGGAALSDSHRKNAKQELPEVDGSKPDVAEPDVAKAGAATSELDGAAQITGALSVPVRGIANALIELASRPDTSTAAPTAASAPQVEQSKPTLGVARTMTLQMNPANLGTVDIRMHMTGQTLDVQLTVSDPRTLGMVNRERDALATALGDQSYALNSLVIQDGGAAASSGGNNAASQGDTSGSNARSERQNNGFGSDGQSSNRPPGQGSNRNLPDEQGLQGEAQPRSGTSRRGGSLFV